jgi:hypothetical protein
MPAQPYALTDKQAQVLDVLHMGPEWTASALTDEGVDVVCDPCDGTGEYLLNTRDACPNCHGTGRRWLCHIEVEQTLERLRALGLADRGWKRDEHGDELCVSVHFVTPQLDPGDPLEQLWALEAFRGEGG